MASAKSSEAKQAKVEEQKPILRDYLETILICVIFVIFTRAFVFQQSKIPSGSMMDTLLIGDYIMVNRFIYAPHSFGWEDGILPLRTIKRGDVVVFKQPNTPEQDFIKRVVGLPGDVVELRDGYLHVNGELVQERYIKDEHRWKLPQHNDPRVENFGPLRVSPDNFFVLGDHRNQSADSRYWGEVPRRLMKGRALLIWWSYNERGDPYPSLVERLKSWGSKVIHFIPRSRWSRCLKLIR